MAMLALLVAVDGILICTHKTHIFGERVGFLLRLHPLRIITISPQSYPWGAERLVKLHCTSELNGLYNVVQEEQNHRHHRSCTEKAAVKVLLVKFVFLELLLVNRVIECGLQRVRCGPPPHAVLPDHDGLKPQIGHTIGFQSAPHQYAHKVEHGTRRVRGEVAHGGEKRARSGPFFFF